MRNARCTLDDVTVRAGELARRFGRGAVADLDASVAPGITLAEALGEFVSFFEPLEVEPLPPTQPSSSVEDDEHSDGE